jgi:hypothetical protein
MAAILNPKWPPKYKNPLIWEKFGFQIKWIFLLQIDNRHRFWNWEPWGGVMSAIALQWQF